MPDAIELLAGFDPFRDDGTPPAGASRGYLLLDVFTDTPLTGNQLAVFTDARGLSVAQMQGLTRELNLSETVFLLPPQAHGDISVRIFTPARELPFAGHPVLGAAVVLGAALGLDALIVETAMAPIPLRLVRSGRSIASGWMMQPIPSWRRFERAAELLAALGLERSALPVEVYDNGPRHVYVELEDEQAVARLTPDLRALTQLGAVNASCFAGEGTSWKTRMFAPSLGVPEDPATGGAAGPLAVHLARHRRIEFGEEIEIRQGAEIGRPSLLRARASGSADAIESVEVGGTVVMLARGEFHLAC